MMINDNTPYMADKKLSIDELDFFSLKCSQSKLPFPYNNDD